MGDSRWMTSKLIELSLVYLRSIAVRDQVLYRLQLVYQMEALHALVRFPSREGLHSAGKAMKSACAVSKCQTREAHFQQVKGIVGGVNRR